MTLHSTNHNGGNGQHPDESSFYANSDFTQYPLIAGFEWNIRHEIGQVTALSLVAKETNKIFTIFRLI